MIAVDVTEAEDDLDALDVVVIATFEAASAVYGSADLGAAAVRLLTRLGDWPPRGAAC